MLQSDARVAGDEPAADPAPGARAEETAEDSRSASQGRRRRYGRRRGAPPAGDAFVSRLGPANGEPFAALDDPVPGDLAAPPRPGPGTALEEIRFVALDCETTGQTPHRLVELGAVAFTLERHLESFETLVHNTDHINPYARRLHGISPATLAGTPRPEPVLDRFLHFIGGSVLIEHSADAFDTRLIGRTIGRPIEADNLDTSRLAARLWGLRDTIGLERLCAELGVSHRRPHHALADAEATAACFLALLQRGRERFGWNTLGDLLADGQPPPPRFLAPGGPPPPRRQRSAAAPARSDAADADTDGPRRRRRRGGRGRRGRGGAAVPPAEAAGSADTGAAPASDDGLEA